jgi:tRNA A37 threonylcarbamoyladenosine dehydratase
MWDLQVSLSSLNRHAVATLANVGRPKSEVLAARLKESVPWCRVDARAAMFTAERALELLAPWAASSRDDPKLAGRRPDFVLDCIDDVNTKADLIAHCVQLGLKCVTACGAGAKADPTRLHMGALSDASRDPLAAKMRWKLKTMQCPLDTVVAVYSSEPPRMKLLPLTDEQALTPTEFGVADGFRTRVMPVLGTSPAIMGQAMAAFVLCEVAQQPFVPQPVATMSAKARHKLAQHLVNRERKVFGNAACIVDADDVHFVVSELWRAKCAATGERYTVLTTGVASVGGQRRPGFFGGLGKGRTRELVHTPSLSSYGMFICLFSVLVRFWLLLLVAFSASSACRWRSRGGGQ